MPNKEILYKSATPMKMIKVLQPGTKKITPLFSKPPSGLKAADGVLYLFFISNHLY